MIPKLTQSGVLPPFVGDSTQPNGMAPFKSTITEFVSHYASTPERIDILKGFLSYRAKLRSVGITSGFQWVDGSFVENIEQNENRAPNDIDIVTFADTQTVGDMREFLINHGSVLDVAESKSKYKCDSYLVDLRVEPSQLVGQSRYWFGLFSHQRATYLWKGLIELPLDCEDEAAASILGLENDNA